MYIYRNEPRVLVANATENARAREVGTSRVLRVSAHSFRRKLPVREIRYSKMPHPRRRGEWKQTKRPRLGRTLGVLALVTSSPQPGPLLIELMRSHVSDVFRFQMARGAAKYLTPPLVTFFRIFRENLRENECAV